MMKRPPGGFTLIELVLVVLLIGILAAVALPQFARLEGAVDNRFTWVGYNLAPDPGPDCFVEYDSFGPGGTGGTTDCTVTLVKAGC